MDPHTILRHFADILKPMADKLMAEYGLSEPLAYLQAWADLLARVSRAQKIKARDREALAALWRIYRRLQEKKQERAIGRDEIIREMDPKHTQCDPKTIQRALTRLRKEYGFVALIDDKWQPLFDPDEFLAKQAEIPLELTLVPPVGQSGKAAAA